jgi:hypothetical protein
MAEQEKPRKQSRRRAAQDARAAMGSVEILAFKFTADRFGYVRSDRATEIEQARQLLRALDYWEETIRELFGDEDAGLQVASTARIISYYPTWSSTLEPRRLVRSALDATTQNAGDATPQNVSFDQATHEAMGELRIYLGMLEAWCETFKAGLWIATIAACASLESTPQRRLVQGLAAITAVCEFDASDARETIRTDLRDVVGKADYLPGAAVPGLSIFPPQIAALVGEANEVLGSSSPPGSVVQEAERFYQWVEKLREKLIAHQQGTPLEGEPWSGIETIYWAQWDWPTAGAVARRALPREALPNAARTTSAQTSYAILDTPKPAPMTPAIQVKMTVLDLMMAARYVVPMLHWRGGLLSIYQWSRILSVATPERLPAMRQPTEAALAQLGFPELVAVFSKPANEGQIASAAVKPGNRRATQMHSPLVGLSVAAETSPCCLWRPEEAACAFALIPRPRAEADAFAIGKESEPMTTILARLGFMANAHGLDEAGRLHLIESDQDEVDPATWLSLAARSLHWPDVHFARRPPRGIAYRFVPIAAGSITELVREVRTKYPELFRDEIRSPWRRMLIRFYRRFEQSSRYDRMRARQQIRALEAWLGLRKPTGDRRSDSA